VFAPVAAAYGFGGVEDAGAQRREVVFDGGAGSPGAGRGNQRRRGERGEKDRNL
jgi:hypothetical protein